MHSLIDWLNEYSWHQSQSIDQSINRTIDKQIHKSINQPIDRTIEQKRANQSINRPNNRTKKNKSINQSTGKWNKKEQIKSINRPINGLFPLHFAMSNIFFISSSVQNAKGNVADFRMFFSLSGITPQKTLVNIHQRRAASLLRRKLSARRWDFRLVRWVTREMKISTKGGGGGGG